ncbi:MAG: M18 family aminopeptidase [Actinomycetota bacterium]
MAEHDTAGLLQWLDACPTPFHSARRAADELVAAGFGEVPGLGGDLPARGVLVREGSVAAWVLAPGARTFRVIGTHTDSPNLRVHPNPSFGAHGWEQLGVEIYGGVLLNSWLDRDLGVAGRVISSTGEQRLFSERRGLARVPQLAIHLDREIGDRGLHLDRQQHMMPVWATTGVDFRDWLAGVSGIPDIAAFDAHLFDAAPAAVLGVDSSLVASGRIDNQLSCWAAVRALAAVEGPLHNVVVVMNDHEEVGSESTTGAAGPLLESVLTAICEAAGMSSTDRHEAMASSFCLSADNAHAVHPNYPERHEPRHAPVINRGPALKLNGNQRYATTSRGASLIRGVAERAGVPLQTFVSRNNMPCGSTIGPITATRLGIECIDVGAPQLSMHSAREMCGAHDAPRLVALMESFASA